MTLPRLTNALSAIARFDASEFCYTAGRKTGGLDMAQRASVLARVRVVTAGEHAIVGRF